jgi:hypothetical protein
MNSTTTYRSRNVRSPFQSTKQFPQTKHAQAMKAFDLQDKRNPIRTEMASCIGVHQITVVITEDTQTLETMDHMQGLIAFLCRLEKDGRVIAEGRGSSVLNQHNKYVSRAIYSAFNSSIVDAVVRSTKVLDTFRGVSEIDDARKALDDVYYARGSEESESATEKQRNYLRQLIGQNVSDEDEREQQLSQVDELTKQEASVMIEAFRQ